MRWGVTWDSRPARLGGMVADTTTVGKGWLEIDVTSVVNVNGSYSFTFSSVSTNGTDFDSRETSRPPKLVVEYLP